MIHGIVLQGLVLCKQREKHKEVELSLAAKMVADITFKRWTKSRLGNDPKDLENDYLYASGRCVQRLLQETL